MSASQMAALASLARGEAAVFGDGDDAPVLVHITGPPQTSPSLRRRRQGHRTQAHRPARPCTGAAPAPVRTTPQPNALRPASSPSRPRSAKGSCGSPPPRCAPRATANSAPQKLVQAIRRDAAPHNREDLVIGCLAARGAEWLADIWGARRSWPFHRTLEFAETLRQLLTDTLNARARGQDTSSVTGSLRLYQQVALDLHQRATDPYPNCSAICTGDLAGSCLYRHPVASTLQRPDVLSAWKDARTRDASVASGYPATLATCVTTIASEILGPNDQPQARRAAALCFAQQAVAAESPAWPPWTRQQFVGGLITQHDTPPRTKTPGSPQHPRRRLSRLSRQRHERNERIQRRQRQPGRTQRRPALGSG